MFEIVLSLNMLFSIFAGGTIRPYNEILAKKLVLLVAVENCVIAVPLKSLILMSVVDLNLCEVKDLMEWHCDYKIFGLDKYDH